MSDGAAPPTLASRHSWLATLLARREDMLGELAQIVGVTPHERLRREPAAALPQVAAFVDGTDFSTATEDARIWLVNRLGLFMASVVIARHGGSLAVQSNPRQRFYLHIVVTGMRPPVPAEARFDPFALAYDAVVGSPRMRLIELLDAAEHELVKSRA